MVSGGFWCVDQEEVEWVARSSVRVETWSAPRRRTNSVHEDWRLDFERLCAGGVTEESGEVEVVGRPGCERVPRQ